MAASDDEGHIHQQRLIGLLAAIRGWNLVLAFSIADGCDPLRWYFEQVAGKVDSQFTAANILCVFAALKPGETSRVHPGIETDRGHKGEQSFPPPARITALAPRATSRGSNASFAKRVYDQRIDPEGGKFCLDLITVGGGAGKALPAQRIGQRRQCAVIADAC